MSYEEPGVKVIQELQQAAANIQSADQVLTLVGELYEVFEDEEHSQRYDAVTGGGEQSFSWPGKKTTSVVDLAGVRKSLDEVDSQLNEFAPYPLTWKLRDPSTSQVFSIDELTDVYTITQDGFKIVEGAAAATARSGGADVSASKNREFYLRAGGLITAGVVTGDRVRLDNGTFNVKGDVVVTYDDNVFFTPDDHDFTVKTATAATDTSLPSEGADATVPVGTRIWVGSGATMELVEYSGLSAAGVFTTDPLVFAHSVGEDVKVEVMDDVELVLDDCDLVTYPGYIDSAVGGLLVGKRVAMWVEQNVVTDGVIDTGVLQSATLALTHDNVGQKVGVWSSAVGDGAVDPGSGVVSVSGTVFTADAGTPFLATHVGSYLLLDAVYVRITAFTSTTEVEISTGAADGAVTASQLYGLVVQTIMAVDADNNADATLDGTAITDATGLPVVLLRPIYRDLVEDDDNTGFHMRHSGSAISSDTGWLYQVPVDIFAEDLTYEIFPDYEILTTYRALDVSSINDLMAVYSASDLTALATVSKDNPLLWAAQSALVAMGTDDIPVFIMPVDLFADEDTGSKTGYPEDKAEALGYLNALDIVERNEGCYYLVPLTRNTTVRDAFSAHALAQSDPCEKNERTCALTYDLPMGDMESTTGIIEVGLEGGNKKILDAGQNFLSQHQLIPGNKVVIQTPTIFAGEYTIASGSTEDELVLEGDNWRQTSGVFDATAKEMTVEDGDFDVVDGQLVSAVTAAFKDAEIGDYLLHGTEARKITAISGDYLTLTYTGLVRTGTVQTVSILRTHVGVNYYAKPMSTTEQAAALKAIGEGRGNRRVLHIWPDEAEQITGSDSQGNDVKEMTPSWFAAAAEMGRCSVIPVQRSSTGLALGGFTALEHSNFYFKKSQLNTIAEGGWAILQQKTKGGPVIMRHLLTTDMSTVKTQEFAFTKNVDNMAKVKRASVEPLLNDENGRINITKKYLISLAVPFQAIFDTFVAKEQLVRTEDAPPYSIVSITQDTTKPDRILERVELNVPLPANNVDVTFVI